MKLLFWSILCFCVLIFVSSKLLTSLDSNLPASTVVSEMLVLDSALTLDARDIKSPVSPNAPSNEFFYTTEPEVGLALPGISKLVSIGELIDPDADYVIEKTQISLVNIGQEFDPDGHDVFVTSVSLVNKGEPFDVDAYLDAIEGVSVLEEVGDELDPEKL